MARLPIPITPTGHVPPSRRCEQCAEARQEAVEATARKRRKKGEPDADEATDLATPSDEETPAPAEL